MTSTSHGPALTSHFPLSRERRSFGVPGVYGRAVGSSDRPLPRTLVDRACARWGRPAVVDGCRRLLLGESPDRAGLVDLVRVLGAPLADHELARDPESYWFRTWAARGLLWSWHDDALPELRTALTDDHWRVREMAAKVAARHRLDDLLEPLDALRVDPNARVRAAAARAVDRIVAADH